MTRETGRHVYCANCDRKLDKSTAIKAEDRKPCPICGSTARRIVIELSGRVDITGSVIARMTARGSASGQVVPVGTAEETETAAPLTSEVGYTTDAVISPVETLERFDVWYEYTDKGAFLLHARIAGTEQVIPFYVGPSDDPDSAAIAVALEFLENIKPPPNEDEASQREQ